MYPAKGQQDAREWAVGGRRGESAEGGLARDSGGNADAAEGEEVLLGGLLQTPFRRCPLWRGMSSDRGCRTSTGGWG